MARSKVKGWIAGWRRLLLYEELFKQKSAHKQFLASSRIPNPAVDHLAEFFLTENLKKLAKEEGVDPNILARLICPLATLNFEGIQPHYSRRGVYFRLGKIWYYLKGIGTSLKGYLIIRPEKGRIFGGMPLSDALWEGVCALTARQVISEASVPAVIDVIEPFELHGRNVENLQLGTIFFALPMKKLIHRACMPGSTVKPNKNVSRSAFLKALAAAVEMWRKTRLFPIDAYEPRNLWVLNLQNFRLLSGEEHKKFSGEIPVLADFEDTAELPLEKVKIFVEKFKLKVKHWAKRRLIRRE